MIASWAGPDQKPKYLVMIIFIVELDVPLKTKLLTHEDKAIIRILIILYVTYEKRNNSQ